jgi:hypothetical protein
MNAMTRTVMTLVAVVLTFGLFPLAQSASAQSSRGLFGARGNSAPSTSAQSANSNCQKLKGIRIDVFDPAAGISSGTITSGGWLNGTTETVINFDAGFVFTPDPNVVAFLSNTTITTIDGQLKASLVTTFNFATGFFNEWGNINPSTSTGRFAGAAGVIFFNGKTIRNIDTGPFESEIVGEICFAP